MKNVVLYARSATSPEEVDRQFQMIQESLGPEANVVGCYSDVGSGMDSHRLGLQQALNRLKKGEAEALLVRSIDRLSRSVQELARLASMFRIELMEPRQDPGNTHTGAFGSA